MILFDWTYIFIQLTIELTILICIHICVFNDLFFTQVLFEDDSSSKMDVDLLHQRYEYVIVILNYKMYIFDLNCNFFLTI